MSINHTIYLAEQKFFQCFLKDATELDDFIDSGNEFHRTGATTLKERSPCRLSLLLGTTSNRRFPRSMRSQGERPGCGSHVKRVDHGDAFNA